MAKYVILASVLLGLTACGDTHQAAPVDDVTATNLGAPK